MKIKMEITGDTLDDHQDLNMFFHSNEMYLAIQDARSVIKRTLKYDETLTEAQEKIFEGLFSTLYIETLEEF